MTLSVAKLGEIRMFASPAIPRGWTPLDGRSLPQNEVPWWLGLIGDAFGATKGSVTLPDMRGRAPMGAPEGAGQGLAAGTETVNLTLGQMPPHTHQIIAGTGDSVVPPARNYFGPVESNGPNAPFNIYSSASPNIPLAAPTLSETGAGTGHENRQPLLAINFCICLQGGFPAMDKFLTDDDGCLGEIRLFAFAVLPEYYLPCDGRLLQISEYTDLYALIGTTYGGDGQSTFALPNMSGRVPVGAGQGPGLSHYAVGAAAGCEQVKLETAQIPAHAHVASVSSLDASMQAPAPQATLGDVQPASLYQTADTTPSGLVPLNDGSVQAAGESQPHTNIQPSLGLQFAICVRGTLPFFG